MDKKKAPTSLKVGSGKGKEFSLEAQCSFHSKEMAEKIKAVVEHC